MKIKYTGEGDASILYTPIGQITVRKEPQEVPDRIAEILLADYPLLVSRAEEKQTKVAIPDLTKGGK